MKDLSVIIPVYNEADNILPLYLSLKKNISCGNYEVIFVNDGSDDNTLENLKKLKDGHVRIISLGVNSGLSAALAAGFRAAKGKEIVTMDGDLQNDPSDIPQLLKGLEHYDVVCGWRYDRKDKFLTKCLPSKIFNLILIVLFNLSIHDSSCTLRAYKRDAAKSLNALDKGYHRFIPVLLSIKGFKVGEIKVKHNPRKFGKAKYNSPLRLIQGLKTLLRIKFLDITKIKKSL